jgi:hypothetical protein
MMETTRQLAGCQREVEDCHRLLAGRLSANDRRATLRRLEEARRLVRELQDELLLSLME